MLIYIDEITVLNTNTDYVYTFDESNGYVDIRGKMYHVRLQRVDRQRWGEITSRCVNFPHSPNQAP